MTPSASPRQQARTDYHQMFLVPSLPVTPIWDRAWSGERLLGICSDGLSAIIATGCAAGPVWVTFRPLHEPPPGLAESMTDWEVGEEETLEITTDLALTWPTAFEPGLPAFSLTRPGLHRVRVPVRGRAEHYDDVVDTPTEEYEITIWPVDQPEPRRRHGDDGLGPSMT